MKILVVLMDADGCLFNEKYWAVTDEYFDLNKKYETKVYGFGDVIDEFFWQADESKKGTPLIEHANQELIDHLKKLQQKRQYDKIIFRSISARQEHGSDVDNANRNGTPLFIEELPKFVEAVKKQFIEAGLNVPVEFDAGLLTDLTLPLRQNGGMHNKIEEYRNNHAKDKLFFTTFPVLYLSRIFKEKLIESLERDVLEFMISVIHNKIDKEEVKYLDKELEGYFKTKIEQFVMSNTYEEYVSESDSSDEESISADEEERIAAKQRIECTFANDTNDELLLRLKKFFDSSFRSKLLQNKIEKEINDNNYISDESKLLSMLHSALLLGEDLESEDKADLLMIDDKRDLLRGLYDFFVRYPYYLSNNIGVEYLPYGIPLHKEEDKLRNFYCEKNQGQPREEFFSAIGLDESSLLQDPTVIFGENYKPTTGTGTLSGNFIVKFCKFLHRLRQNSNSYLINYVTDWNKIAEIFEQCLNIKKPDANIAFSAAQAAGQFGIHHHETQGNSSLPTPKDGLSKSMPFPK